VPLNIEGHVACGAAGCWEDHLNLATLSLLWLGFVSPNKLHDAKKGSFGSGFDCAGTRRRSWRCHVQSTAHFLGLGLGTIVNVINPECIYLDGEITTAWDLIESTVTLAQSQRALTERGGRTPLRIAAITEHSRLRGAAALIAAPTFAAPRVA
jgi:predicted NBD/HSP70 family sugar kinase